MLIETVAYDSNIGKINLKELSLKKSYKNSCYFSTSRGQIVTFLKNPNQLVPLGIVVRENVFAEIKDKKILSAEIFAGVAIELKLPEKTHIPEYCAQIVSKIWRKMEILFKAEIESIIQAGKYEKLVGAGEGLTPLGDDFLVGFIAAKKVRGEGIKSDFDFSRTTELGRHFLVNAVRGNFSRNIINFLKDGDLSILDYGQTSGVATAMGILNGLGLKK
ncbi:MAG: DUF2877 domain-containing protein [Elusimicrobia bacterium]|nr:DUF2877 domain-containing protein [Elusimicrobiota bacterium]